MLTEEHKVAREENQKITKHFLWKSRVQEFSVHWWSRKGNMMATFNYLKNFKKKKKGEGVRKKEKEKLNHVNLTQGRVKAQ